MIAFDNGAKSHYDSCGTVSWQILDPDSQQPITGAALYDDLGRRLNIAYNTYWK